jgi:MFS family permease
VNAPVADALLGWLARAEPAARRALLAASLGWMLDAFDVMLYAMVLSALMASMGMSMATAGLLGSTTLVASAVGGVLFGVYADRYGRKPALMVSVLIYSIFTAACGLARSVGQLALFRTLLGFGMGGEWTSGAALVSETWPDQHRAKAMAVMQSSWAIGYGAAALVTAMVLPRFGWRAVFFVGILPALFTLWIRRHVEEPAIWRRSAEAAAGASARAGTGVGVILGARYRTLTLALTLMNACTMFGWWGLNLWIPAYLALPVAQGGVGLAPASMAGFVAAMQVGMWFGYVTFGFIGDSVGRKRAYLAYLLAAAVLLPLYGNVREPAALLLLGPFVAFFGTGYFSGFGAITAEIYPTAIRASAQGLTYNVGRLMSALAPFVVGSLADEAGFGLAFGVTGAAFLAAAVAWIWIPETRGRALP